MRSYGCSRAWPLDLLRGNSNIAVTRAAWVSIRHDYYQEFFTRAGRLSKCIR
jgi:hypothetical protein